MLPSSNSSPWVKRIMVYLSASSPNSALIFFTAFCSSSEKGLMFMTNTIACWYIYWSLSSSKCQSVLYRISQGCPLSLPVSLPPLLSPWNTLLSQKRQIWHLWKPSSSEWCFLKSFFQRQSSPPAQSWSWTLEENRENMKNVTSWFSITWASLAVVFLKQYLIMGLQ